MTTPLQRVFDALSPTQRAPGSMEILEIVRELQASEQRLYDALFLLTTELPPASLAGKYCHVCDPQAGERILNVANSAMQAASCCTFKDSTSDLTYERNRLRERLDAACRLLRQALPMHYRGLAIDREILDFLAEVKPASADEDATNAQR